MIRLMENHRHIAPPTKSVGIVHGPFGPTMLLDLTTRVRRWLDDLCEGNGESHVTCEERKPGCTLKASLRRRHRADPALG